MQLWSRSPNTTKTAKPKQVDMCATVKKRIALAWEKLEHWERISEILLDSESRETLFNRDCLLERGEIPLHLEFDVEKLTERAPDEMDGSFYRHYITDVSARPGYEEPRPEYPDIIVFSVNGVRNKHLTNEQMTEAKSAIGEVEFKRTFKGRLTREEAKTKFGVKLVSVWDWLSTKGHLGTGARTHRDSKGNVIWYSISTWLRAPRMGSFAISRFNMGINYRLTRKGARAYVKSMEGTPEHDAYGLMLVIASEVNSRFRKRRLGSILRKINNEVVQRRLLLTELQNEEAKLSELQDSVERGGLSYEDLVSAERAGTKQAAKDLNQLGLLDADLEVAGIMRRLDEETEQ